jgi:histidinol-phosphate aminotransferase
MSNFEDFIPPYIRGMGRYVPGKSVKQAESESGIRSIKLASNENTFGPSPLAVEAMHRAITESNWYPEADNAELKRLLAAKHGVTTDHVLVTAGTSSFLHIIGRTLLAPGLNAITSELSFISYPIVCQAAGATLIKVPMRNYTYDLDGIAAAINSDTRVVFIANPNNPTGTFVGVDEVRRFLERVPEHVLVVLDEAYADFAEHFARERGVEYSRGVQYIRERPNIVVTRTFSKAQGLAGLRLGYGLAHPDLMQHFSRVKVVFSVSSIAEAAGIAALTDEAHIQKTLRNNLEQSKYLHQQLTELGLRPLETWANFVYVDVGEDSVEIAKKLQNEGIIIRPLTNWGAKTGIRVSIGKPEENHAFVTALKRVLTPVSVRYR